MADIEQSIYSTDEFLATEIGKRPFIYDKTKNLHNSRTALENAWRQIKEEYTKVYVKDIECDELKRLWKNLRERYRRGKEKFEKMIVMSAGALDITSTFYMQDKLSFLNDHINNKRNSESNLCSSQHVLCDYGPADDCNPTSTSPLPTTVNNKELNCSFPYDDTMSSLDNSNHGIDEIDTYLPSSSKYRTNRVGTKRKRSDIEETEKRAEVVYNIVDNCRDNDWQFLKGCLKTLKEIKSPRVQARTKAYIMQVLYEAAYLNKVGDEVFTVDDQST